MQIINALKEIENSTGYEFALMTTFNIDVDFFERQIISRLVGAGTKKIALFVDAQELSKGINDTWKKVLLMGKRYSVNPISISGSFHPKVLLLLSDDKAKLFISSANYTKSGYSTNNEVFNVFEMNPENIEYLHLIQKAFEFFMKAYDLSYDLDPQIISETKEIPYIKQGQASVPGDTYLLHNLDSSILSQIKETINVVTSIDIAVPFYDNDLNAVKEMASAFPDAVINCYVQNHKCRFNVEKASGINNVSVHAFDGFLEPKSRSFYHGKVFRFNTTTNSWILYGSANCTGAALQRSTKLNGNTECSILERGEANEFDYFFDNLLLTDPDEEIKCELLEYTAEDYVEKYSFKYGVVVEDKVSICIGVTGAYAEPVIKINGEVLDFEYDAKEKTIRATASRELLLNSEELLLLRILESTNEYELKGWLINAAALEAYRRLDSKPGEFKYVPDPEGDERIDNILNVLQNLALGYERMRRKDEVVKLVESKEKKETPPDIDYEDAPEGIIDYVIPPRIPTAEEYLEYRNYKKAERIARSVIRSFLKRNADERQQKIDAYKEKKTTHSSSSKRRKPSTAEQRGRRIINAAIKKMCDDESLRNDSAEHFLQGVCEISDALSQYSSTFVENMFDPMFIVDKRCDLLEGALKIEDEFSDEHIKALIQLAVETHYIQTRAAGSITLKKRDIDEVIRGIDQKFEIRDIAETLITDETTLQIGDHIEDVFFEPDQYGVVNGVRPSRKEIISYLDTAFGYRTRAQIENLIYSRFGETAVISTENQVFLISCLARLKDWFNGDKWLMNEIDSYCRHYSVPVDSITLDIRGVQIPDGPDPTVRLKFTKELGKYSIKREEYHKSGDIIKSNESAQIYKQKTPKYNEKAEVQQKLNVGDVVYHKKYGEAMVINIVRKEDGNVIELMFNNGEEKKFGENLLMKVIACK